jgi:RND family efflux transporter MFP subunit
MSNASDLLKELRIDRSREPEPARRGPWIGAAVVVALALVAGGWWLFGRDSAIQVRTAQATAIGRGGGSASVLDASGYVVARRIATVSSKVTGKVKEVLIEEGQRVAEGDILAYLDPTDADAQLALAQAQLAQSQSQLAQAQAQLKLAEGNLVRQKELAARQLVAASALDAAVADRDTRAADLASQQRAVKVAQDQLAIARNGVDNTVIRAPFAGVIVDKAAQPGEMISPVSAGGGSIRTGIGTLVDMDSLEVEVDVGEAFIGRVQPKMPVEAVLNAYPDWKIPAEVIAIVPTADRGKATVKVRIALKSKDPRIVPEMGVRVSFLEKSAPADANAPPPGVLVPSAAIVQRDGQPVAFVVVDHKVAQRQLTLGRTLGDDREVTAGIAGGDSVVVDPPDALADGMAVRVAGAADAAADDQQ